MPRFRDDWPPDAVVRFWNYFATHTTDEREYFSRQLGAGIVGLAAEHGMIRSGAGVLDLGTGLGFLAERLVDAGCDVWGVDSSDESRARSNARLASRPGWHGATPEPPDREFDAVMCIETVEHLPDAILSETLTGIRAALRPGGAALITTPNNENIHANPVYCPFCDSEFHPMQHVRSFTASTLRAALEQADLVVSFCAPVHLVEFSRFRLRTDMPRYTAHQALLRTRRRLHVPVDARVPRPHLCAIARRPD